MKIIFLTVPAYGHINPILGIVEELVKKNHQVIVYNALDFEKKIKETGAEFRPPPIAIGKINLPSMRNTIKIAEYTLSVSDRLIPSLINIINKEKPDLLVHDSLSVWGKIIAQKTKVKTISLVPSMALNFKIFLANSRYLLSDYLMLITQPLRTRNLIKKYRQVYKSNGVKPPLIFDIFSNVEDLNIVFTSEVFQLFRNDFGPNFKFVGPVIYDRKEGPTPLVLLKTRRPVIYIALGTVYNDDPEIYKKIINALKDSPYQVIVSFGKYLKAKDLGRIPKNFYIKDYLPQLEVLKKASLFISHAGMNSINESLYFGVPMIMLPQIQEQRINAARVEELGAGIYYKENKINEYKFMTLVQEILKNQSYKENAEKIRQTLINSGGLNMAVENILDYLK